MPFRFGYKKKLVYLQRNHNKNRRLKKWKRKLMIKRITHKNNHYMSLKLKYIANVCEAIQLNRLNIDQVRRFSNGSAGRLVIPSNGEGRCWCTINDGGTISILEEGDFLIKNARGKLKFSVVSKEFIESNYDTIR